MKNVIVTAAAVDNELEISIEIKTTSTGYINLHIYLQDMTVLVI